jgi:hypothetical protein
VRCEWTREVTGRRRVESINGDDSSKIKRKQHGRGETGEAVTRLRLLMVRQRLEGHTVQWRGPNVRQQRGHREEEDDGLVGLCGLRG